jgi:hypothetical protein
MYDDPNYGLFVYVDNQLNTDNYAKWDALLYDQDPAAR